MFILNTRPKNQAQSLNDLIKKTGGNFFNLPAIKIIPIAYQQPNLNNLDYIIFQSANAVKYFFKQSELQKIHSKIIAIGPATQKSLENLGFKNIILPNVFSSMGILKILYNIQNKKILIISGKNPKLTLLNQLQKNNTDVNIISCYQRICPKYNMNIVFQKLLQNNINIIVSTSFEGLKNLLDIFQNHLDWLFAKTLCVISEAMSVFAKSHGFSTVIQSKNATNHAIIEALVT